jgi:hypothetical protein
LALAGRAALWPILPARNPGITDEFSYTLASKTFASGRLTNPAHPMWVHFETMHVNQRPTYMSMYPPAQGLVMAAGERLAGRPWVGIWISSALMCALICWMLQGWLPPFWALLGGLLAVMRIGLFSYWAGSYWGGAVAAIGGALVLGALPRILRRARIRDSLLLACGVAILLNSRPYEGVFLCLPVGFVMLRWIFGRRRPRLATVFGRVVAPAALVLTLTAAAMLRYNERLTGDPLLLPYQVNRAEYVSARYFPWDSVNPKPVYRHSSLRDYYVTWQHRTAENALTALGFIRNALRNAGVFWMFFLGPALTLPLVMLPWLLRDKRFRLLLIAACVFVVGLYLDLWFYAHYAAPATCLLYAVLLQCLRHLRCWRRRQGSPGLLLARGVPAICVGMVALRLAAQPLAFYLPPDHPAVWFHTRPGNVERAKIVERLSNLGSDHLILVRYHPGHNWFDEWVYNAPDIDRSPVVWAHDMGAAGNRELLDYFRGRRVWLIEPDDRPPLRPPKLSPYAPVNQR